MDVLVDAVREAVGLLFSGDPYLWQIIGKSLQVSGLAVLFGLLAGIPLGTWLGLARTLGLERKPRPVRRLHEHLAEAS